MKKHFETQLGSQTPINKERLESLSEKITHLGKKLEIGDHLYFAYLNDGLGDEPKNIKLIMLSEDEFSNYEIHSKEYTTSLPILKLKRI